MGDIGDPGPTSRPQWVIFIRRFFCAVLYYTGLNFAFRLLFRRNDCVVLMYHRVIDQDNLTGPRARFVHPGAYVTKRTFEMQMAYVARHFSVIDVLALVSAAENGGKLPNNACVITFDDGWRDNHTCAFPILKRYNLPATIFLVSDYVGTNRRFWQETLSLMLSECLASPRATESLASTCPAVEWHGISTVLANRRVAWAKRIQVCLEAIQALAPTERSTIMKELEAALALHDIPVDQSERVVLNWDEVAEMGMSRINFGSHTRNHPILTEVSVAEAIEEVAALKPVIEAHLSTDWFAFSYPNGQFDADIKRNVMAHYKCAFSADPGFVKPGDDVFSLKRMGIHNEGSFTEAMFACKTSGLWDLFVKIWKPRKPLDRRGGDPSKPLEKCADPRRTRCRSWS
jgi:peptidoglycan/xylan/chitin deacetylase (PgdA/CDA1 family)